MSFEKIKAGVFDGPHLVEDEHLIGTKSEIQKNAWLAFKNIAKDFLGNTRAQSYAEIVQQLLESFKLLGCNMSIKFAFFT